MQQQESVICSYSKLPDCCKNELKCVPNFQIYTNSQAVSLVHTTCVPCPRPVDLGVIFWHPGPQASFWTPVSMACGHGCNFLTPMTTGGVHSPWTRIVCTELKLCDTASKVSYYVQPVMAQCCSHRNAAKMLHQWQPRFWNRLDDEENYLARELEFYNSKMTKL